MTDLGKLIILLGVGLVVFGVLIMLFGRIGGMPGDVHIRRGNFSFLFPIATCVVASVVLTLLLNFVLRIRR